MYLLPWGVTKRTLMNLKFSELEKMGKMIVYSSDLSIGAKISDENLEMRSPLEGISTSHWDSIVGKTLKKNVLALDPVAYEDLI